MNYYDHDRWPHLLAAIRAAPTDDLPRLVAATGILAATRDV